MASTQTHFRSISLPSRLPSTNPTNFEKLKSWNNSKSGPISSEAVQSGLVGLAELYNSVDELVQSSANSVDELVQSSANQTPQIHQDGLMELIDSCNTIRELFQMIRENVQSLQSALRRKGQDSTIRNDVASYLCMRKRMNRCVARSLKTLKNLETKNLSVNAHQKDLIREAIEVSIAIFKGILVFLSCPMAKSGGWNLISKLMLNKSGRSHGVMSEVESVDLAVNNLKSPSTKVLDGEMVQRSLQDLDSCILGFETGLERLFRQLIQCRVTLLNILTEN